MDPVWVTPYRYVVDRSRGTFPGMSYAVLCDLYLVSGRTPAFDPFRDSWVVRTERYRDDPSLSRGSFQVRAEPAEIERWTEAQQAVLVEMREAEWQLIDDHGMVEVRDSPSMRSLRGAPGLRGFWRRLRRTRRRSRRAFGRYRERIGRAAEAYRPVWDEITARVREAQRQARERWERMSSVASRPWWSYRVDREARVVHVFHEDDSALDTRKLSQELLEIRRETGITTVRWAPGARETVERDSGAAFATWWRTFTKDYWTDPEQIPETRRTSSGRVVHVSAHTSFSGIDTSGFSGVDSSGFSPPSIHF